jgi:tetratricopeptide (TPR) repeat protein
MKLKFVFIGIQIILFASLLYSQADKEYLAQGDEYTAKFDNLNAVKSYDGAYKVSPNSYAVLSRITLAYNDEGEELLDLKKRDKAEKYIDQAIKYAEILHKKFPDSALSYTYLALTYGNMAIFKGGKQKIIYAEKVRKNALKSIKMNPSDYFPYIILGMYYREAAGLSWFEKIFAKTFLGGVPEGTYQQSVQMFNRALSLDSNLIIADYQLSKTYKNMGEKDKEIKLLKKVLTMHIRNFRDQYAIIKARHRLKKLMN